MTTPAELRDRLQASQERLARALSGVTEEQFKRRPPPTDADPAPWCIAEVLAHVLLIEDLWCGRISLALEQTASDITPSPEEAHEEGARRGRHLPVPTLIHGLLGARHQTEKLLQAATSERGTLRPNSLWHPRLQQSLDLAWMFDKIAGHHEAHLGHIEALREAAGAPPLAQPEPRPTPPARPSGGRHDLLALSNE